MHKFLKYANTTDQEYGGYSANKSDSEWGMFQILRLNYGGYCAVIND